MATITKIRTTAIITGIAFFIFRNLRCVLIISDSRNIVITYFYMFPSQLLSLSGPLFYKTSEQAGLRSSFDRETHSPAVSRSSGTGALTARLQDAFSFILLCFQTEHLCVCGLRTLHLIISDLGQPSP